MGVLRPIFTAIALFGLIVAASPFHASATPASAATISAPAAGFVDRQATGASHAELVTTYDGGSTVVDEPIWARTLDIHTTYRVFLPPGYAESNRRYPVLYMLHGVAGDSSEWQSIGLLEAADRMIQAGEIDPLLIVLPNGFANYWVNHADGMRWADYVVDDVVPSVDVQFRSIRSREGRAIGGLSMGGEGALRLALQHPDVFSIAAAHSPSLRTAFNQFPPELQDMYGSEADWKASSPLWIFANTSPEARLTIMLDVGADDPWRPNVELLDEWFDEQGIVHRFDVLPGAHEPEYWIGYVDRYLSNYSAAFAANGISGVTAPTDADSGARHQWSVG
jgi:enterochelin esterase-like enzyme